MYSVYVLYSLGLTKYYIGYSSQVSNRLNYHNDLDKNVIWTKRGIPWTLFLEINELSEPQAIKIESHLKKMKSKRYLENLKRYPEMVAKLKERYI